MEQIRFADEAEKKGGWTLSPKFLDEIYDKISNYEDAPSWEGIELVLLAYHNLALPKATETTE